MSTMTAMRAPPPFPSTAKAAAGGTRPVATATHHLSGANNCTQPLQIKVYRPFDSVDCTQTMCIKVYRPFDI